VETYYKSIDTIVDFGFYEYLLDKFKLIKNELKKCAIFINVECHE